MTAPRDGRVLVADDQPDVLDALRLLLGEEGYACVAVRSPSEILAALEDADFDVAIIDLNYTRDTTSGQEGFELLARMQAIDRTLPVLVMTAWGSVAGAVEAMRRGARDYIEKPWDDERLLAAVATQVALRRALRQSERLQAENARRQRRDMPVFIAESPAMQAVRQTVERIAPSDAAVLITGEHGTGKEVVALWLHARSDRAQKPLVTMNAGGLTEGVAESELFGHVKGAFTDAKADRLGCFELADEGTLFLDEIANMPIALQAKLLRVLQTGEFRRVGSSRVQHVDVRLISATNADPAAEVAAGRFREDLLYRAEHRAPSTCRRCATGGRTSRRSPRTSWPATRRATARRSAASSRARGRPRSPPLAGQRARDRPRDRARRADGRGPAAHARRPRPGRPRRRRPRARRAGHPRSGRAGPHPEGAGPPRRRRAPRRRAARHEPQRTLPAAAAPWPLTLRAPLGGDAPASTAPWRGSCSSRRLPGVAAAIVLLWRQAYSFEVRWTVATLVVVVLARGGGARPPGGGPHAQPDRQPAGRAARGRLLDPRPGARGPARALGLVVHEVNDLGRTLQRQRTEAVESTALLSGVMAEIDVARVRLRPGRTGCCSSNPAGARLLGADAEALGGHHAHDLGFEPYLSGEPRRARSSVRSRRAPAGGRCGAPRSTATAARTGWSCSPT